MVRAVSEVYDYTPRIAGRPVDVAAADGAVSKLEIFDSSARTGTALVTVNGSTANGDGSFRFSFDPPDLPNRYYLRVTWTASSTAAATVDSTPFLDLPVRYDLLVSAESVAVKLGVPLPLTDDQRARIEQEIIAAQDDAANYINRAIFPVFETQTGWLPLVGYDVLDYRAWPLLLEIYDDRVAVLSATLNGSSYDVAVMVGIDGRNEPTLTRFVLAAAAEAIRTDPGSGMGKRLVTSMSAEGQSITYDKSTATPGVAGSLPTIDSLKSLKRASWHRSARRADPPFPYRDTYQRVY